MPEFTPGFTPGVTPGTGGGTPPPSTQPYYRSPLDRQGTAPRIKAGDPCVDSNGKPGTYQQTPDGLRCIPSGGIAKIQQCEDNYDKEIRQANTWKTTGVIDQVTFNVFIDTAEQNRINCYKPKSSIAAGVIGNVLIAVLIVTGLVFLGRAIYNSSN